MDKTAHIFLDFDGVLHKLDGSYRNNEFIYNHRLEFLVNSLLSNDYVVDITISSSWRLNNSIEQLNSFLGDSIVLKLNKLSVDTTCAEIYSKTYFDYQKEDYKVQNNRYLEIKDYIIKNNISNYVVLDDSHGLFFKTISRPFYEDNIIVNLIDNNDKTNNYLDDFDKNFINRFISTYKPKISDGYLSLEDIKKAFDKLSNKK